MGSVSVYKNADLQKNYFQLSTRYVMVSYHFNWFSLLVQLLADRPPQITTACLCHLWNRLDPPAVIQQHHITQRQSNRSHKYKLIDYTIVTVENTNMSDTCPLLHPSNFCLGH